MSNKSDFISNMKPSNFGLILGQLTCWKELTVAVLKTGLNINKLHDLELPIELLF